MGVGKDWFLSLQNKAEGLVFRIVDEKLKNRGESQFYDVFTVSSIRVEEYWRGLLTTTLEDGTYYEVTYNTETKVTKVGILKHTEDYVFPD